MDHQPVHAPIDPGAIGVLGNDRMPGADVAAAVAAMNQGYGKFKDINGITQIDIFFAWTGLD